MQNFEFKLVPRIQILNSKFHYLNRVYTVSLFHYIRMTWQKYILKFQFELDLNFKISIPNLIPEYEFKVLV